VDVMAWIDKQRNWWKTFLLVFVVSVCVVGYLGVEAYQYEPPRANFVDENGSVVFSGEDIVKGQQVFLRYNLMDYGSFLGDGALRGPDFTGEALHQTARFMVEHMDREWQARIPDAETRGAVVESLMQKELKHNRYDENYYVDRGGEQGAYDPGAVVMTPAEVHAFGKVAQFYAEKFGEGGELAGIEVFSPANYITDPQAVHQLAAFFYWGGWICAAERPGFEYSYTHNWPYDPLVGNLPHGGIVLWSILSTLALLLAIGALFYHYGKTEREQILDSESANTPPLTTNELLDGAKPMPTQRATYKIFALAAVLFGMQVAAGLWTVADFVSLGSTIGIPLQQWLPVTVTRAWHTQMSFLWISICWFAATIWLLPLICRPEPKLQRVLIEALFALLIVVVLGTTLGIPLGIKGELGDGEVQRFFGQQGWEFMQLGRAYQYLLFAAFVLWGVILVRGVWPVLRQKQSWSLPNWMVYMAGGIILMFTASFVADPETSFVIADFWRWCTVHMWLEAFFELFTTVITAYFLYLM